MKHDSEDTAPCFLRPCWALPPEALVARVRTVLKDSRWQSFKRGCKWNGRQMALVRASVVCDVLSMAGNPPDPAPVLLPPTTGSLNQQAAGLSWHRLFCSCQVGGVLKPRQGNNAFNTEDRHDATSQGESKSNLKFLHSLPYLIRKPQNCCCRTERPHLGNHFQ